MSLPWPWLPGEYVSGPRVAETILRPVRPTRLIPDDEDVAAKFVETHCLAWGGQAGFVLPYSRSHGLSEGWRELLEVLDPDEVFALGPLQESVKDGLTDGGRFVYPRGEPAGTFHSGLHPGAIGAGRLRSRPQTARKRPLRGYSQARRAWEVQKGCLPQAERLSCRDYGDARQTGARVQQGTNPIPVLDLLPGPRVVVPCPEHLRQ